MNNITLGDKEDEDLEKMEKPIGATMTAVDLQILPDTDEKPYKLPEDDPEPQIVTMSISIASNSEPPTPIV